MELVCAAGAGIAARLLSHPLDTIKTVAFTGFAGEQTRASRAGLAHTTRAIWRREGVRGFYRGVGVSLLGAAPGVALYLTMYNACSTALLRLHASHEPTSQLGDAFARHVPRSVLYFVSGLLAEAVSCVFWVPVDVTKERLQSQPPTLRGRYRNSLDAVRTMCRKEGVRGLYKGYWSTLGSFGPFSAVYFVCYESFTRRLSHYTTSSITSDNDDDDDNDVETRQSQRGFGTAFVAGAAANTMASLCTNPLELVKTRLQVQRAILHGCAGTTQQHGNVNTVGHAGLQRPASLFPYTYRGLRDGIRHVVREGGGVTALWRGVGCRILYAAPNAALTMAFYELLMARYVRV